MVCRDQHVRSSSLPNTSNYRFVVLMGSVRVEDDEIWTESVNIGLRRLDQQLCRVTTNRKIRNFEWSSWIPCAQVTCNFSPPSLLRNRLSVKEYANRAVQLTGHARQKSQAVLQIQSRLRAYSRSGNRSCKLTG